MLIPCNDFKLAVWLPAEVLIPLNNISELFFEYFYGKPQQRVDVTSNDESINMPLINFVATESE